MAFHLNGYSNFHDDNQDWFVSKIKSIEDTEAHTEDLAEAAQASADASQASAEASQLSAEAAQTSAEAAQQSAENAAESETNAAQSELSAKNYADHIADPVSGIVTDWLDEHVTPTTPVVDESLTISGAAADAKVTGDKIAEINNDLLIDRTAIEEMQTVEPVSLTMNRGSAISIPAGEIISAGNSFYVSSPVTVNAGELYRITCEGYGNAAAYALGSEGVLSEIYPESIAGTSQFHYVIDKLILIPEGVTELYIANTTQGETTPYSVNKIVSIDPVLYTEQTKTEEEQKIARLNISAAGLSDFDDIADPVYTDYEITTTGSKYINRNGNIIDYEDHPTYTITNHIDVESKSFVKVSGRANLENAICVFYDENDTVIKIALKAAAGSTITTYTDEIVQVPSGSSYMLLASIIREPAASYLDRYVPKKKFDGLKWAAVGDSLTESNSRTTVNYHDYIADETGITVYNMGKSGSGYKRKEDTNNAFYQRVLNIPLDTDVVTIFGSGNDQIYYASDLGTATDTGTETVGGCINTTIDNIYSILPTVQLGIIAPCPWQSYNPVNHHNGMAQYTELLREICYNRSIPFLDLYHESNLRPWDSNFRALAYSHDDGNGTHPDETGHKLLAGRMRVFLDSLIGQY